ncbi:M48 family metallopeptidase [Phenylobacterium sp.]|uniref:M48 family metallopeptidase n=1 Tax=Phenylobacterium sp. TaxID=1871053 RepID=UPI0025DF540B|nr:M48 family metallopeptidase [Phenylobacterium sp.]
MEARFHDGRTTASRPVKVWVEDEVLVFHADGEQRWPLETVRVEMVDDRVRVARAGDDPARLSIALSDWRDLTEHAVRHHRAVRRRELWLVGALATSAAVIAGVVFVGIPAASGPLARATPPDLERKIGRNLGGQVSLAFPACKGVAGQAALHGLGQRLGKTSGTPFDIRVRAVHAPMVNAFALPGGTIMVTDQLIALAADPAELSAVIAHEAAHVEKRHVMQAVWRSFGFGVLLDAVVGGGTGAGQQAVLLLGSSTNLRYGRASEAEADAAGQDLLTEQGLSSQGMAPFFQRLVNTSESKNAGAVKELISDHPDSQRRAAVSRARAKPGATAFTPTEWVAIKATCKDGYDPLKRVRSLF